ncbi:MAG TPA: type II toxin-antitoxin system VapC family toxin [Candidatus Rubneribacter avistercoris]|nr:type II toxin-antitoxin system VapC family toxin [Candidatus Rubneribacter avistercoris]
MQVLIDETVILRYLLEDDKRLFKEASTVIAAGEAYTYPEIFARVAVTLRDVYRVPRSQIGHTLVELLEDVYVVEEDIVRYASRLFGSSMLDYIDCLLVARNALHGDQIMSFDKPLMKRNLAL